MPRNRLSSFPLILILGALATVSPFSIDMYLPAFPQLTTALGTTPAKISWSLSSYFVGLSVGQVFYGPLLDRYGRKPPIYVGLSLYVLASIGCVTATNVEMLIALRFLQALGGCVAQVGAMAMVRDFFPVKESAKVFSFLILILSVSPLLAPTAGGFVTTVFGWKAVFICLAAMAAILLAVVAVFLPEGHEPDPSVSLRPGKILGAFRSVLAEPGFRTPALASAFGFSGLFVYVAGSPTIFMEGFGLSATTYGAIFAGLSVGFIGSSQANLLLLKRYRSDQLFRGAVFFQAFMSTLLVLGTALGWLTLQTTLLLLFPTLACVGLANPNASALSLAPFTRNVGTAAALLGFLQMGVGGLASTGVGFLDSRGSVPILGLLAVMSWLGALVILVGKMPQLDRVGAETVGAGH